MLYTFFQQSKNMHIRWIVSSKLSVDVCVLLVYLSLYDSVMNCRLVQDATYALWQLEEAPGPCKPGFKKKQVLKMNGWIKKAEVYQS